MKSHARLVISCLAASLILETGFSKAYGQLPEIHRIKRVHVESEAINLIGYHHKTRTLEIQFHSGETYRYAKVPVTIYNGLLNAESKGRYFQEQVRGRYAFWKVETK